MQQSDQAIGQFASSEMEVDEGYVGERSASRRSASALVAAGPATSAPKSSRMSFTAAPTFQESSTKRTFKPLRSSNDLAAGAS